MNNTTKNVLKIVCVAAGAALSMVGNIMGSNDKKDNAKNDSGAEQK